MKNFNDTPLLLLLLLLLLLILTVAVTAKTTVSEPMPPVSVKTHERAAMRHGSSTNEANFEIDGHSKVCWTPGPCFKKKLVCPKKCRKLPGEGGTADGDLRLVKNHFPGQCVFNCKKCIAHC